jgi:transposase
MSGHISGDKIVVVETRRRWTDEERQRALNDTLAASVSSVARKHGIAKSLLFRWRKEAGLCGKRSGVKKPSASFVPVALPAPSAVAETPGGSSPRMPDRGLIEIELAGGRMVRVSGAVESEALRRVIAVLEGR